MKTIIFDKNAPAWTKSNKCNLTYLQLQTDYIKELFACRGYIYLNQIYEYLGVAWNPGLVSPCYLIKLGQLNFEFEELSDDTIMIKIGR